MDGILSILLFFIGLIFGRQAERKHLRELDAREAVLLPQFHLDNRKHVSSPATVADAQMVTGSCVIGCDGAKAFFIAWRNLIGGEHKSIQRMLTRGRREAILRMLEEARHLQADEIWNVQLATSSIGTGTPQAEIIAYGTAIKRRPA